MLTHLPSPDLRATVHNLALVVKDVAVELARLRQIVDGEPETCIIDVEPNGNADVNALVIEPQLEGMRE